MTYSLLPTRPLFRYLLISIVSLALLSAFTFLFFLRYLWTPISALSESVIFEVAPGSSFTRITANLELAGYLEYPLLFRLLARWRGVENVIKTGEHEIPAQLSPIQLLDNLVQGNIKQYRITLVEGWTFEQAVNAIWSSEKTVRELHEYDPNIISDKLELSVSDPEGMLFPDTYFYTAGTTDLQILRRAHSRLTEVLEDAWEKRLGALPYASAYEALVLASIIEKESAYGAERGHVAGVFVRRLETGMRLQSDPTVIYGLGDSFDGNLTRAHLQELTPYNTYRIAALPPTPIALAGLESITASLHPLPSDYLYFVAKGNGEHHFSKTLEEHNAAVRLYQKAVMRD